MPLYARQDHPLADPRQSGGAPRSLRALLAGILWATFKDAEAVAPEGEDLNLSSTAYQRTVEATAWIESDVDDGSLCYLSICRFLHLDPARGRRHVRQVKQRIRERLSEE